MNKDKNYQEVNFHWFDYVTFLIMVGLTTGLGVYNGYIRKLGIIRAKVRSIRVRHFGGSLKLYEYLLGARKLEAFPVAMSLVATCISGFPFFRDVTSIYCIGIQPSVALISIFFHAIAIIKIYLPVFVALRVDSSNEYLEKRFSSLVRSIASIIFVLYEILYMPLLLFAPAISIHFATGINVHLIAFIMCVLCVSYTLIGGIETVIQTSLYQVLLMFFSLALVVVFGVQYAGGIIEVIETASEGGRLMLNTSVSPYDRDTIWVVLIDGFFYFTSYNSVNPTMVQRYMCLPSRKKAERAIFLFTLGILIFIFVCCFAGLLLYYYYKDFDSFKNTPIKCADELFYLYVMQVIDNSHGVPGIFFAGFFCVALSSLSIVLNTTAMVVLEDITKVLFGLHVSEKTSIILVKSCIAALGVVAVCLVFVLERSGHIYIYHVAHVVTPIAVATTFGLFSLGMLVPWANNKGALIGVLAGVLIVSWMIWNTNIPYEIERPVMKVTPGPQIHTIIDNIRPRPNITSPAKHATDINPLYRLSFHWTNLIGVLATVLVGTVVSFITGPTIIKTLDAKVLSPVIHRYLPRQCFSARITRRRRRRTRRGRR